MDWGPIASLENDAICVVKKRLLSVGNTSEGCVRILVGVSCATAEQRGHFLLFLILVAVWSLSVRLMVIST